MKSWMCARARGVLDLGAARAGPAVGDVVVDRVVEQHRVLRHDADRAAQAVLRDLADVLAVDRDRAGVDVVEAEQQPRQRRLAGAARPDHRDCRARRDREVDVVQDRPPRVVAEVDVPEARPRRAAPRAAGAPGRSSISGCVVEQREHLLEVGQRLLDLAVDHAEEVERDVELDQVGVDQHEVADRHRARGDALSPPASSRRSARRR